MSAPQFTSGGWEVSDTRYRSDGCDRRNICDDHDHVVAVVPARSWAAADEANASLIAAAPELYEALEALLAEARERGGKLSDGEVLGCSAIRKANGKQSA